MLGSITESKLTKWAEDASKMSPLPISPMTWFVGHPRSGTTLLSQILDGHERLVTADELMVFSASTFPRLAQATGVHDHSNILDILERTTINQLNTSRELFLTQVQGAMCESIADRQLLNKNPDLTLLLPVICRLFPEAKILFALRDPRDVVVSCFTQFLPLNPISVGYFSIDSTIDKYAMSMNLWLKMREFMGNQWLETRYEDTVNDLSGEAGRILSFLGLDWDDGVLDFHQRSRNKHVHSPTYESVTKPIYNTSIGRWKNYEKHVAPACEKLLPFIEAFGYSD